MKWLAVCLLGLAACQGSPLFHHAPAPEDSSSPAQAFSSQNSNCPLFFEKEALCADLSWVTDLSHKQGGTLKLRFWSKLDGSSAGPYSAPQGTPFALFWMPHHGHGSSASITGGEGQYLIQGIFLRMPGRWDLHLQLKAGDSVLEESVIEDVAR